MSSGQRATLAALADVLVPGGHGMPSASAAGIGSSGLDRVLAALPELLEPLQALADEAAGRHPQEVVASLLESGEAGLLGIVVAGGYLTEPAIEALLGYGRREPRPVTDDLDDEVVSLLEPVLERGSIYRSV